MPTAAGAKWDIVLSTPKKSIENILDILTENDDNRKPGELRGVAQTGAFIVWTVAKDQLTCELCLAPTASTIRCPGKRCHGAVMRGTRQRCQTTGPCDGSQSLKSLSSRKRGSE